MDVPATSPSAWRKGATGRTSDPEPEVLPEREMRRRGCENVLAALRLAGGRVYGPAGAADLLGVKPTTLASRIRKMGIERPGRPH